MHPSMSQEAWGVGGGTSVTQGDLGVLSFTQALGSELERCRQQGENDRRQSHMPNGNSSFTIAGEEGRI